jgi:hypothetical protein
VALKNPDFAAGAFILNIGCFLVVLVARVKSWEIGKGPSRSLGQAKA